MRGMVSEYIFDLKKEFFHYNKHSFTADLLAGITVAAVSLPLALAFGVSSGADAPAGLITAIISAFIIGALSGASYQISGPTGAMAAILIPLATKNGLNTVFIAGALSGIILVIAGILKAGRIASFLPKAVITGFTSGIAIIIALGQIENFFGVKSHGEEAYIRVFNMLNDGFSPNINAAIIGTSVIAIIFLWPKKWGAKVPASLAAVIISTIAQIVFDFPVDTVGAIPKTLLHETRLSFSDIWNIKLDVVVMPAISIAALSMIESLLCGAAAGKMKGEKLRNDRELVAQGIGNILLPFFGGVPATAAIARTSVAVKSGGKTRLTGIIQGIMLLLSMFLLSPFMSKIPMPALSGVLIATAWRMNEWKSIGYIFNKKFKGAIGKFLITLICTVLFDLTIAIVVGCMFSMIIYIVRSSSLDVTISEFESKRIDKDISLLQHVQVIYITGPVFFGSANSFADKIREATGSALILSMRGVPNIDSSGVQEILEFCHEKKSNNINILFCGVQPKVMDFFDRAGITKVVGKENFFWKAEDALLSLNDVTVKS